MMIRAYLRASTKSQDVDRARASLEEFVASKGHRVAARYSETHPGGPANAPSCGGCLMIRIPAMFCWSKELTD